MDMHFTPPSWWTCTTNCDNTLPHSDADNIRNASMMKAQYIRFDISWSVVENASGSFSSSALGYYQAVLETMSTQEIAAIAIVGTSEPSWLYNYASNAGDCVTGYYTVGNQQFPIFDTSVELNAAKAYSSRIASQMGSLIGYYQLGNELNWLGPNTMQTEMVCGSSPTQYITALAQGVGQGNPIGHHYQRIVNAYGDTPVTGCSSNGDWYSSLSNWLSQSGSYIDVIALDHYPGYFCGNIFSHPRWATDGYLNSLRSLASQYHKAYGILETGFSSYTCSPSRYRAICFQRKTRTYGLNKLSRTFTRTLRTTHRAIPCCSWDTSDLQTTANRRRGGARPLGNVASVCSVATPRTNRPS